MNTKKYVLILVLLSLVLILLPIGLSLILNYITQVESGPTNGAVNVNEYLGSPSEVKNFQVSSTEGWQNTGVFVRKGDQIRINASGIVQLSVGKKATPDGFEDYGNEDPFARVSPGERCFLLLCDSSKKTGTLVGKIGDASLQDYKDGFFLGLESKITANKDGYLMLGINDVFLKEDRSGLDAGSVSDNSGSFDVVIEVYTKK